MRKRWFVLLGFAIGVCVTLLCPRHSPPVGSFRSVDDPSFADREMDRVIAKVDMDAVPFDRAVEDVRKLTRAEISVEWEELKKVGFDPKSLVTMHGTDVLLGQALDQLTARNSEASPLAYGVVDGRIVITTLDRLSRNPTVHCYDVGDVISKSILASDPDTMGQIIEFPTTAPVPVPPWDKQRADNLIEVIEAFVSPDSWRDDGGSVGAIHYIAGRIAVVQNWQNHRKIQQLLRQLREPDPAPAPIAEKRWSAIRKEWIVPEVAEKLEARIRRPIASVDFNGVSFESAVETLRRSSGVNIILDQGWLVADFFSKTPVSLHVNDLPLSKVLDLLLDQRIGGCWFGYTVDDGIVVISTRDHADKQTITRVYDVRDLIPPIGTERRDEVIDSLIKVCETSVDIDSWKDNGGQIGAIRQMNGRLVVTQTWSNHEKFSRVVETLRKNGMSLHPTTQQ